MRFIGNVIRAVFRLGALVFMLAGLVAAGFFVAIVAAADGRAQQSLGQVWFQHDPFVSIVGTPSLPLLGAIVERKIHPFLWNPVFTKVLSWPSSSAVLAIAGFLLVLAAILFLVSGKRRAPIQQNLNQQADTTNTSAAASDAD